MGKPTEPTPTDVVTTERLVRIIPEKDKSLLEKEIFEKELAG